MEKPATITVTDEAGEIVYMKFIDKSLMDDYIEQLERIADDFVLIISGDEEFYSLPGYIERLINEN